MPEGEPKELHAYLPIAVASSPASPGQERIKDGKGDATLPGCSPKQTLCATERRKLPKSQLKKRSEFIAEKFPQGRRAHKAGRAGGRGIPSAAREIKSTDCCKHDVS
jgi:hypothetical protein